MKIIFGGGGGLGSRHALGHGEVGDPCDFFRTENGVEFHPFLETLQVGSPQKLLAVSSIRIFRENWF